MAKNPLELLGVDKETALTFIDDLYNAIRRIENIEFIMQKEFGKVPDLPEDREKVLDESGGRGNYDPVVLNTREITGLEEYDLLRRLGGRSTNGHVKCISGTIQISWDARQRSNYLPWYDLEKDEIIEFRSDVINRVRFQPKGDSAEFKAVFK